MSVFQVDFGIPVPVASASSLGYVLYKAGVALGPRIAAGILPADWPDGITAGLRGGAYSVLVDTGVTPADTLVWDTGGSSPQTYSVPLVAPPLPVLATITIPVFYAPSPATAALLITEGGASDGPYPAAVSGPAADGVTFALTASLTSLPAGLGPGGAAVQAGDLVNGVFVPAAVNGVAVPPAGGMLALSGGAAPVLPAIPPHLYSVARWRAMMRNLIVDEPLLVPEGQIVDPSALVVISDAQIDEALREALAALSEWRPAVRALPPIALVPGQSVYPLPADFAQAVDETWGSLLGPDPLLSGQFPGSRDFFRRRQGQRDSGLPYGLAGGYGSGTGYAGLWSGTFYGGSGGLPILPEDAQGNIIAGGQHYRSRVDFYPASYDAPAPVMVLTPPPMQRQVLGGLTYHAILIPQRLTVNAAGADWLRDMNGSLAFAPAFLSQDFTDGTDVLPFSPSDDAVRLSLRYGQAWLLMAKVIPLAATDSEKWAFYEVHTGLGRKDLLTMAKTSMDEFNARTKGKPRGGRF